MFKGLSWKKREEKYPRVGPDGKTKQQRYVERNREKVYAANALRNREKRRKMKATNEVARENKSPPKDVHAVEDHVALVKEQAAMAQRFEQIEESVRLWAEEVDEALDDLNMDSWVNFERSELDVELRAMSRQGKSETEAMEGLMHEILDNGGKMKLHRDTWWKCVDLLKSAVGRTTAIKAAVALVTAEERPHCWTMEGLLNGNGRELPVILRTRV
ncbi:hypothetical protein B0H34DRAFT_678189 [Crassisporium funariophilum]|nr:hypothetical protein B0H34DRAFT_678189 [Crassisporium funariophilum]